MAADVVKEGVDWLTGIGTAGGLGVFIYLVRLFLTRQKESEAAQAAQLEQHSKDTQLQREAHLKDAQAQREQFAISQKEMRESFTGVVTEMGQRFSEDLKETRETFATQVNELTDKFAEKHEAQMRVNQETVTAINGLREDVHQLKDKVK